MKRTRMILLAVVTVMAVAGPSPIVRQAQACDPEAWYTFDAVSLWCDFGGHDCYWCDVAK